MNRSALVSLIVPVYNEADGLDALIGELSKLQTNRFGDSFEFVLVDDGSTDATWEELLLWAEHEPRLTLVRLAGNRGAHRAARAGLETARGDVMIMIPADLQEGIDLVQSCLEAWHQSGNMVVMMAPKHGRVYDSRLSAWAAALFYLMLRATTGLYKNVPVRSQVKLMDRVATDAFLKSSSAYAIRAPFVLRQNFPCDVVYYEVQKRSRGKSKWNLRKKTALFLDVLIDVSAWVLSPWRIAAAGFALYACLTAASWVFGSAGQALAAVADLSLGATVLAVLAVLGVHVVRIHEELRGRPVYVIREVRRGGVHSPRSQAQLGNALPGSFASETHRVRSVAKRSFAEMGSQAELGNQKSPIPNPQSPIPNPQPPTPNPQSPIPNPQSPIPSP